MCWRGWISNNKQQQQQWQQQQWQQQQQQQQEEATQTNQEINMEENETPHAEVQGAVAAEEDDGSDKPSFIADEAKDNQGCFSLPGLFDEVDAQGLSLLPESFRINLLQKVFNVVVMLYDKEELDRMRRSKKWKAACQKIKHGALSEERAIKVCKSLSQWIPTTDEELWSWQSLINDDDCLSHVLFLGKDRSVIRNDVTDGSKSSSPVSFVVVMTNPLTLCFRHSNYYGFQGVRATARERQP